MVKLNELYVIAGKVVVVCDVAYDAEHGSLIFYKEEQNPNSFLHCESEKTFLSIASPYTYDPLDTEHI